MLKRTMFLMTLVSTFLFSNLIFAQEYTGGAAQSDESAQSDGTAQSDQPAQSDGAAYSMGFVEIDLGYGLCQGDCDDIDGSVGFSLAGFYNINQNIAVGANFTYQMLSPDVDDASYYAMSFSGEGRYYHPIMPKLRAYGLGALGYAQGELEMEVLGNTITADDSGVFVKVGGGVEYSIMPKVTAGCQLYYQYNMWSEEDEEGDTADLNFIFIGLSATYSF